MNNKIIFWVVMVAVCLTIVWLGAMAFDRGPTGRYDTFAKCLAEKNLKMYGAYWCSHCQNQKREFGSSFEFVSYVECTQQPEVCKLAGVTGYPTWISADGKKYEGEQSLNRLAEISGCELKEDANQK